MKSRGKGLNTSVSTDVEICYHLSKHIDSTANMSHTYQRTIFLRAFQHNPFVAYHGIYKVPEGFHGVPYKSQKQRLLSHEERSEIAYKRTLPRPIADHYSVFAASFLIYV